MAVWSDPGAIQDAISRRRKRNPLEVEAPSVAPTRVSSVGRQVDRMTGNRGNNVRPGESQKKKQAGPVQRYNPRQQTKGNVSFLTQNMGKKSARANLRNIIRDDPGVIGFGELSGRNYAIAKRILNRNGYGLHGQNGTPVAWDKSEFKLKDKGREKISDRTYVGPRGAGPSTLKAKYANWIRLKDRDTGDRSTFTTAHLAPSRFIPVRGRLQDQQIRNLAAVQSRLERMFPGASHTLMGDFNTSKRKNLRPLMNQTDMRAYRAPGKTHRVGFIDWILSDANMRDRFLRDYGSDHRGYWGSY